MTEEEKREISEEKKFCKCNCKELKMFLLVIFGSFLGCLVALCLFSATMRPKFPPPMQMKVHPQVQQMYEGKFDRHQGKRSEFNRQRKDVRYEFRGERKVQDRPDNAQMMRGPHPFDEDKD